MQNVDGFWTAGEAGWRSVCLYVAAALGLAVAVGFVGVSGTATATDGGEQLTVQDDPWINVNVSDTQGQQGDTVTVVVEVEELVEDREQQKALGYNLLFDYDTDVVEFVGAESVAFDNATVYQDPPYGTEFEAEPENSGEYGVVRVADMETDTEAEPAFTAVELQFELIGDPGSETVIEIPAETDEGEELGGVSRNPLQGWPATFESGTVRILEEETPVGTITGTVTDEAGEPIEGASVNVGGTEATTGADGSYELEVEEGSYGVRISADGYSRQTHEVTVEAEGTTTRDTQLAVDESASDENGDGDDTDGTIVLLGLAIALVALAGGALGTVIGLVARFTGVVELT